MKTTSKTLSVFIGRRSTEVYEFASDPVNLPRWATAFCKSVSQSEGNWIAHTSLGPIKIRFVDRNDLGVLDHYAVLPSGVEVYVPMRVIPNRIGSEVIFTLLRSPDMTDEKFAEDGRMVEQDLQTLKSVLEK
jgi:hypothetical protein